MKLHQIIFSPTGGTKRVCKYLVAGMIAGFDNGATVNLCAKAENICLPHLDEDDFAVIAMPVFASRVPALAKDRLRQIESNHARCVVVAVYGNRAYDDALLELHDIATEMGFRVIAAIGAVAEHSIIRKYGQGRPDAEDMKVLQEFGLKIAQKVAIGNETPPIVQGNRPYKRPMEGPHPRANRNCKACGACAKTCPVEATSLVNPRKIDKHKCISCMKCVAVCPSQARSIGMIMNFLVARMLKKPCASRKSNELFL